MVCQLMLVVTDVMPLDCNHLEVYMADVFCDCGCILAILIVSHTPDEARSVGLVKACVLSKNLFCYREISFYIIKETE